MDLRGALSSSGHFISSSQLRVAAVRARSAGVDEFDSIISQPNDAYFKQVFSHLPRATLFFQTHLDPALVAQRARQVTLLRPTPVAIHDDGHVAGALARTARACRALAVPGPASEQAPPCRLCRRPAAMDL